jgi:hypothetical protein
MKKRITHIDPLRLGVMLGGIYGALSLIIVPIFLLVMLATHPGGFREAFFVIFLPIIYAVAGFIGGLIAGALYNLLAGWTGGIEVTVEDAPTAG